MIPARWALTAPADPEATRTLAAEVAALFLHGFLESSGRAEATPEPVRRKSA